MLIYLARDGYEGSSFELFAKKPKFKAQGGKVTAIGGGKRVCVTDLEVDSLFPGASEMVPGEVRSFSILEVRE